MAEPERTLEQAAEAVIEEFLTLLDGCDDDDTVRPQLLLESLRDAINPDMEIPESGLTAREVKARLREGRRWLAEGETIP